MGLFKKIGQGISKAVKWVGNLFSKDNVGSTTGVVDTAANIVNGAVANANAMNIAQQNLDYQNLANQQNIDLQREINAVNLANQNIQNQINREREDNAIQRAVKDMQAAGLSKTLAAGSPASASNMSASVGNAPTVNPLENGFQFTPIQLNTLGIAERLQQMENNQKIADAQAENLAAQAKYNLAAACNKAGLDAEAIAKSQAERSLLGIDAEIKELEKNYDKLTFEDRQYLVKLQRAEQSLEVLIKNHDYSIFSDLGLPTNFSNGIFGQIVTGFGSQFRNIFPSLFNH